MKNTDILQACFENICKNYNVPAGLHISEPMQGRVWHDLSTIFIDIHAANCLNFHDKEIWMNILETEIKSKKDYRKLRSMVRLKLIDAIHSLRNLTEESLRNLGAKV